MALLYGRGGRLTAPKTAISGPRQLDDLDRAAAGGRPPLEGGDGPRFQIRNYAKVPEIFAARTAAGRAAISAPAALLYTGPSA
jgi:hypothetical protein